MKKWRRRGGDEERKGVGRVSLISTFLQVKFSDSCVPLRAWAPRKTGWGREGKGGEGRGREGKEGTNGGEDETHKKLLILFFFFIFFI